MNNLTFIDSVRAIIGEYGFDGDQPTIEQIATAGVEMVIENSDAVLDMRSAVYMYHLVQSLIKFSDDGDTYKTYVGKYRYTANSCCFITSKI